MNRRKNGHVPERGDIVWLDFNPQAGHEQAGRRPALIISPSSYNGKVGLVVCCPITSKAKGLPFEVKLPADRKVTGVILADQFKTLDWRARNAELTDKVDPDTVDEVVGLYLPLIDPHNVFTLSDDEPAG